MRESVLQNAEAEPAQHQAAILPCRSESVPREFPNRKTIRTVSLSPPANFSSPVPVPSLHELCRIGIGFGTAQSMLPRIANKTPNYPMERHLLSNSRRDSHAQPPIRIQPYLLLYERNRILGFRKP
jgi:hypothetical protein